MLPPGIDTDPTTIWALEPIADNLIAVLQAATIVGIVVPIGVVVHRYRRSSGTARDQMRWLLWGALVTSTVVLLTVVLDLGALTAPVFFVCFTLVPIAMTVAVVNPSIVSIEELLGRTLVLALLAVVAGRRRPPRRRRAERPARDSLEQAQVVLVVLLVTVLLYGPFRQRLSRWVRRLVLGDRADPYDAVAGLASTLENADEGSEQLVAVAGAVASAFGVGYVSVEVERSGGERLVATYGERPAETRTLPIPTATPRSAAWCCPRAGCAAGCRAATRSCSATWSGRPRPRPAPAGSPRTSRTAGSGWSPPARRSAAGSAATCTTASGRRSAASCSSSSRPG